jgi:hypothetical protein
MTVKRCSRCKEDKCLSEFYRCASKRDGLQSCCKACSKAQTAGRSAYYKAYREENGDTIRARNRAYNEANSDKRKAYQAANFDRRKAAYSASA